MPTADSYERSAAANAAASAKAAAAKPTLSFSAWDAASPEVQKKYTPVAPKAAKPAEKPSLNFSAWDSGTKSTQNKYKPITSSTGNTSTTSTSTTSTSTTTTPTTGTTPTGILTGIVTATPYTPYTPPAAPAAQPIKTAPIDTVLFNDSVVDPSIIIDLLFEDVGGQEILSITRHDTVNGQPVAYQPIKNLGILQEEYNPNNLIKLQQTSDSIFNNYPINLSYKTPTVGNGPGGSNIYLDTNGDLVIEFVNLAKDEQVDVQITSNGTIYEAGI